MKETNEKDFNIFFWLFKNVIYIRTDIILTVCDR
jgi:hypothetical protein